MRKEIERLAKEAGNIILNASDIKIDEKSGRRDLVTSKDIEIQNMLTEELSKLCPGCSFLCEETADTDTCDISKGIAFIIDPIDGTANFVHGPAPGRKDPVELYCSLSLGIGTNSFLPKKEKELILTVKSSLSLIHRSIHVYPYSVQRLMTTRLMLRHLILPFFSMKCLQMSEGQVQQRLTSAGLL